jgi:hypothetical protein
VPYAWVVWKANKLFKKFIAICPKITHFEGEEGYKSISLHNIDKVDWARMRMRLDE